MIDTHCHLDFDAFDPDRQEVLERSRKVGIERWINPGVDFESCRRAVNLAHQYKGIFAAVGIHPTDDDHGLKQELSFVKNLASQPKVVGIGEIGIDHYHKNIPAEIQSARFAAQLNLAAELDLPVIIHSREAMPEVLAILTSWVNQLDKGNSSIRKYPGVLHAFEGNLEEAGRAHELGFYFGVGGSVTYQNAPEKREVFGKIPLEALLLETDAPFLTPHPHRGHRNEPAFIPLIAQTLADIHETSIDEVARITTQNADTLFARRIAD